MITAVAKGSVTVMVTTDPGGLTATQTLEATVPNRAPDEGLAPGPDRPSRPDSHARRLALLYRRRRGRAELRSVILEPVGGCRFHFRSDGDDHRGG